MVSKNDGAILAQDVGRDSISKAKGEMQEGKSQNSLRIFNLIPSGIFPCRYGDVFGMVIQQRVGDFKAHIGC